MDAAATSVMHAPMSAAAARRSGLSANAFLAPTPRAFAIAALSGAAMALTAGAAPMPGTPGCDDAGTVHAQHQIGAYVGGFGEGLDAGDIFGTSIASIDDLDGDGTDDLIVGAAADDDGGTDRGAVWILFMNADGTVRSKQKISSTQGGFGGGLANADWFGTWVESLSDFDGDGVADLAIGAHGTDDGGVDRGAVWILFMNTDGTVKAKQKISSTQGGFGGGLANDDGFGFSVALLGDIDSDGVVDLGVGAIRTDDGATDRGAVWILFLNSNATVKAHQKIAHNMGGFSRPLANNDLFGLSVGSLGDLDGDGTIDVAVGAPWDDSAGIDRGAVWVLFLNPNGTVKTHQKIAHNIGGFTGPLSNNDALGVAVTSLGDLDGDGLTDLAVGAEMDDSGGANRGALWLLFLNPNGTVKAHRKISQTTGGFAGSLTNGGGFGRSMTLRGDLGGDGRTTIAVGAEAREAPLNPGEVWLGGCRTRIAFR